MTKPNSHMPEPIQNKLDHIFRHEYSKLISYLSAKFGVEHLDHIEDAVQEALYKAMKLWPFKDFPDNPGKWLYRVAYNHLIDTLRRDKKTIPFDLSSEENNMIDQHSYHEDEIFDEQLKMIFACCHPTLKESDQLILSLKFLCGFSTKEIARALIKEPEAIKKATARAKQKFKGQVGVLELPSNQYLQKRVSSVLKVIYLLFNNGYTALDGHQLVKNDVCEEALRLATLLYQNKSYNTPPLCALMALMCFNLSRFNARVDAQGRLVSMEKQDRTKWDNELIIFGSRLLNESAVGEVLSTYHLEAAIGYEYAHSSDFKSINWVVILQHYNQLMKINPTPMIQLNRLVAYEKVASTKEALAQLGKLDENQFKKNHIYFAIKADFEKKLKFPTFRKSLEKAIELTTNEKEKEFLQKQLF